MNGAVYISFFQGQLESVLEQVVQLAVQEISKTVGSSLNALLLETAGKEQENRRLRLQLQARDKPGGRGNGTGNPSANPADGGGSTVAGRADSGRTKPGYPPPPPPPPPPLHAPGGQGTGPGVPPDLRRLEQRGRVVDQLKAVMEQVLDFAVHELTKIVEASFDDLLLEITKMEREHQVLEENLDRRDRRGGGRRRGSENDSVSPSGSEDTRDEPPNVTAATKRTPETRDPDRPPVLSVSQDWVPILDKVFGQKWCSDLWQIKERGGGGGGRGGAGGLSLGASLAPPSLTLEPSPSSPQQDPRWTPLEDMEVFSPDEDAADGQKNSTAPPPSGPPLPGPPPGPPLSGPPLPGPPPPGSPLSPTGSSGRRSSASMLHRLLTLPSQQLEDEDEDEDAASRTLAADGLSDRRDAVEPPDPSPPATRGEEEEEEEQDEEDEDKGRKKKRRRVWSECEECGRRFSRMSLLKAHRQTHVADTPSPLPPQGGAAASAPHCSHCSHCGKRFSSMTRLHSHILTQHPGNRP